ncbi:hypothetical protein JOC85_004151 [Bacillus mesophilus]|nr:hypothetical protein [Bacillus mesophilus]
MKIWIETYYLKIETYFDSFFDPGDGDCVAEYNMITVPI